MTAAIESNAAERKNTLLDWFVCLVEQTGFYFQDSHSTEDRAKTILSKTLKAVEFVPRDWNRFRLTNDPLNLDSAMMVIFTALNDVAAEKNGDADGSFSMIFSEVELFIKDMKDDGIEMTRRAL